MSTSVISIGNKVRGVPATAVDYAYIRKERK